MKNLSLAALAILTSLPALTCAQVWPTTKWTAECIPGEDCGLEENSMTYDVLLAQLEEASIWLEDLGFAAPHVQQNDSSADLRWIAYFANCRVNENNCRRGNDEHTDRNVQSGLYWRRTKKIELSSIDYFQYEGEEDKTSTPIHELFHGVQASYDWYPRGALADWRWFIEGTAEAVEVVDAGSASKSKHRPYYDYPLNELASRHNGTFDPYASFQFWLYLGNQLGSESVIDYFVDLFDNVPNADPVASVEDGLEAIGENGFWDIYPAFIAQFQSRRYYERHPNPMRLRARRTFSDRWEQTEREVNRLAAAYQEIIVESVGRDGGLIEIELFGEDDEALHLVVDDTVVTGEQSGEKNVYRVFMAEPDELIVRVVNVAYPAEETKKQRYTLRARFLEEFAYLGTERGSGPSGADVDAPLPFDLPVIKQALVMPGPMEQHVDAGLNDVCMMQLQFENPDTGDALLLKMDKEGVFEKADHYVHRGASFRTERFPGEFVTLFTIGKDNGMGMGWTLSYSGVSGTVTLQSVSKSYIKGKARLNLEYAAWASCTDPMGRKPELGNGVECPDLLRNIVVSAEFGVFPEMTLGAAEKLGKSIEQCTGDRPSRGLLIPDGDDSIYAPGFTIEPDDLDLDDPRPTQSGNDTHVDSEENSNDPIRSDTSESIAGQGTGFPADDGVLRWMQLEASGDVDDVIEIRDFQLVSSCESGRPFGILFLDGDPNSEDFFQIDFSTDGALGSRQTGTFELREVKWDYGTVSAKNAPAELNIRVPNRFTGGGTLDLLENSIAESPQRMRGILRGAGLRNAEGLTTNIEMKFQIDWACASN